MESGEELYNYYIKIHFPFCNCRYNWRNIYMADILYKKTKIYRHKLFCDRNELNKYLESIKNYYSVCITKNTPLNKLNGGVIFLTNEGNATKLTKKFMRNEEISNIIFYNWNQLQENINTIQEYPIFTPIRDTMYILKNTDLYVLICTESYNGISTFPKGKRTLDEDSASCGIREFYEETGFEVSRDIFEDSYQLRQRQVLKLDVPLSLRIFNCLFQIIIYD
jgi:hypothetical protein